MRRFSRAGFVTGACRPRPAARAFRPARIRRLARRAQALCHVFAGCATGRSPFFLALVAATLIPACGSRRDAGGDDEGRAVDVPTISAEIGRVVRRDLVRSVDVRGTIAAAPNQDVKVSALVAGRVTAVRVAEGDAVRAGQVVAEIDRRPFQDQRRQTAAALDQARAALENARLNLERTEQLFRRGIAAGKEVEDARNQFAAATAGVEQATAALDTAERQLARTRVTAPIAGEVVKRLVSVGEQVDGSAAQPIAQIANLARVELAASVPSEYLARVRVGQEANVTCDAYAERRFRGRVLAIAPAVDPTTNAALVRVQLDNPERLLKVGMFAEARIDVEQRRGVLVVPPAAIVRDQAGAAVYVVSGDTAERTPVLTGVETPEYVELVSGVTEGQKILVSAIYGLGARVRLARPS